MEKGTKPTEVMETIIEEEEEEVESSSDTELTKKEEEKVETNNKDEKNEPKPKENENNIEIEMEIEEEEEDIDDKFFDAIKETINSKNNILELDINDFVDEHQIDSNDNDKLNLFTSIISVIQKNDNPLSMTYLNYTSLLEFFKGWSNLFYFSSYKTRENIFALKLIPTQKDDIEENIEEEEEEETLENSIDTTKFINLVVDTAHLFNIRLNENMITNLFENLSGELCELNSWENLFAICNPNAISGNIIGNLFEKINDPISLAIAIIQTEHQDIFQQVSFNKNTIESIIIDIILAASNKIISVTTKNILNLLKLCAKGEFPENHVKFIDNKLFLGNGEKFIVTNDFLENILPAFSPESLSLSFKRHLLENYNDNLSEEILFNLISNYFNNKKVNGKIPADSLINFFKHYENILSENILAPLLKYLPDKIIIDLFTKLFIPNQQLTSAIFAIAYKNMFAENNFKVMDLCLTSPKPNESNIKFISKLLNFYYGNEIDSKIKIISHLLDLVTQMLSKDNDKNVNNCIIDIIHKIPKEINIPAEFVALILDRCHDFWINNYIIFDFIYKHALNKKISSKLIVNTLSLCNSQFVFDNFDDNLLNDLSQETIFLLIQTLLQKSNKYPITSENFNMVYNALSNILQGNIVSFLSNRNENNFFYLVKLLETLEPNNLTRASKEICEYLKNTTISDPKKTSYEILDCLMTFKEKLNKQEIVEIVEYLLESLTQILLKDESNVVSVNNHFLSCLLLDLPPEVTIPIELKILSLDKYRDTNPDSNLIINFIFKYCNNKEENKKISPYSMINFLKNCDNDSILKSNFSDFALKFFPPNTIFYLFAEIFIPRQLIQSVITNENFNTVYNLLKENNRTNIFSFLCENETTFFYLLGLLKADNLTIISNEIYLYLTSEPVFENEIFWSQISKGSEIQCKILYTVFAHVGYNHNNVDLEMLKKLITKLNCKEKSFFRKPTNLNNLYENYPDLRTNLFIIINVIEKNNPQVTKSLNKFFSWSLEEIQQKSHNANVHNKNVNTRNFDNDNNQSITSVEPKNSESDSEKTSLKPQMKQAKTTAEKQKETNPKSKKAINNNENDFSDFSEEEDR